MKNIILTIVLVFTINTFGQTYPTTPPQETKPSTSQNKSKSKSKSTKHKTTSTTKTNGDEVVKKALYTPAEKEKSRKNFIKDIDSIGMSPEIKNEYTKIVKKHWKPYWHR